MSRKRTRGNGEGSIFKRQDGGAWYITWYNADGKRQSICTKTTDKSAAARILANKVADVALRREGVIDAKLEAIQQQAAASIETHLSAFETRLQARKRKAKHIRDVTTIIREVCRAAEFNSPSEITADGVNQFMAQMAATGNAPRTIQKRVAAMKQFTKWLTDHAKLQHDPLRSVRAPNIKVDRRKRRRMLLPEEWPYLRGATLTNGTHNDMTALERAILYATAIQTGLRSAELRSLSKRDLFLSGEQPHVRCGADNTKNNAEAKQYIDADLAEDLRRLVARKTPAAPVFPMPNEYDVAAMLREDLAAARKKWLEEVRHDAEASAERAESDFLAPKNDQGEVLDFHALRHTTGAWLALQGLHPNVIKTVMRHSTITLTMDTYGHLLPDQHAEAVGGIAAMMGDQRPRAATGTAGAGATRAAVHTAVAVRNELSQNTGFLQIPGKACEPVRNAVQADVAETLEKTRAGAGLCLPVQEGASERAAEKERGPSRIRTGDGGFAIRCQDAKNPEFTEELELSEFDAAVRAAVAGNPAIRDEILAMIQAAKKE